jgi:hypothetical protein
MRPTCGAIRPWENITIDAGLRRRTEQRAWN